MSITPRHGKSPGYQVSVQILGVRRSRFFGEKRYGNLTSALHRAQRFERSLIYRRDKARAAQRRLDGEPGIYHYIKHHAGHSHEVVQAVWREDGQRRSTCFHVATHGLTGAYTLARQARG